MDAYKLVNKERNNYFNYFRIFGRITNCNIEMFYLVTVLFIYMFVTHLLIRLEYIIYFLIRMIIKLCYI